MGNTLLVGSEPRVPNDFSQIKFMCVGCLPETKLNWYVKDIHRIIVQDSATH